MDLKRAGSPTMKSFSPGPEHALELRAALGTFPTGVTVITAATWMEGKVTPVAMTANSFTSVSLNPPLILWCPAQVSARHDAFVNAVHFSVHILSEDQRIVAQHFARCGDDFSAIPHHIGPQGVPQLDGCVTRLDCTTEQVMDGGDHSIILGRVRRAHVSDARPLAFCTGRFSDIKIDT